MWAFVSRFLNEFDDFDGKECPESSCLTIKYVIEWSNL